MYNYVQEWCTTVFKNEVEQCSSMMYNNVQVWCTTAAMYFQNAAKSIHNERLQCKNLFHFLLEQKMTLTVKTEGKFQERLQWIFGSNSHLRLKFAVLQKLNGDGQKIKVFPVSRGKNTPWCQATPSLRCWEKDLVSWRKNNIFRVWKTYIFVIYYCCCYLRASVIDNLSHLLISYWWVIGSRV